LEETQVADIKKNLSTWNKEDWSGLNEGETWSRPWGNSENQWFGSLFFRTHLFLPSRTILEIAPGHGRWTQYLKRYCSHLYVVDLSSNCIDKCKYRFRDDANISFFVNDGKSLAMIPNGEIDFIFSFDSLVHADIDVIEGYICQFYKKLSSHGVAFIHHSNIAEYMKKGLSFIPRELLKKENFNRAWRSETVDASTVRILAIKYGLSVISQEKFNWNGIGIFDKSIYHDCITVITPAGSKWSRDTKCIYTDDFLQQEAKMFKQLGDCYSACSFRSD
jgi:SAM-dependent methyltransferase